MADNDYYNSGEKGKYAASAMRELSGLGYPR